MPETPAAAASKSVCRSVLSAIANRRSSIQHHPNGPNPRPPPSRPSRVGEVGDPEILGTRGTPAACAPARAHDPVGRLPLRPPDEGDLSRGVATGDPTDLLREHGCVLHGRS